MGESIGLLFLVLIYPLLLATVNGVLGGYENISDLDLKSSFEFLSAYYPLGSYSRCCDCGAGIGRVSKGLLVKLFDQVDLVEPNQEFLNEAKTNYTRQVSEKIGQFIQCGLEEFYPVSERYDLIWCQWVLGQIKDLDLIEFLKRCKSSLVKGGMIGIKENITRVGSEFDAIDSSLTRSDSVLKDIFVKSGLELVKEETQTGFPQELYSVKMYLLK